MSWANLDDKFADHPKVSALSDAAFRLHIAAICHCAAYLTDGFIEEDRPRRLTRTATKKTVAELVASGLWGEVDGGYMIHDYLEWNLSREQIQKRHEQQKARGKKGAEARWGTP